MENETKQWEEFETVDSAVAEQPTLPAIVEPKMEQNALTMWNDLSMFETTQRMAKLLASSNIAPQSYRGNVADCVVAIDMANRMGLSPIVVMQNSQIVHGNFSWKGTACKAMIDSCGRYTKTKYVWVGEKGNDSWGCYLEAIDKDGEIVKGTTVTIAMAKAEGWYDKNGSKWKTMPELMMQYRASAFFLRTQCASLAMGFLTAEEQNDIYGQENQEKLSRVAKLLNEQGE
jgi:hypothetical protein